MGNLITDILQYEGTLRVMNSVVDFFEKRDYSEINVKSLVRELKDIINKNVEIHIIEGSVQIISNSLDEYTEIKKTIEIIAGDSFTSHPSIKERDYAYIYPRRSDIINGINAADRFIAELRKVFNAAKVRLYITYESNGEVAITF